MNHSSNVVSIHPYFKPHAGQFAAFQALLPEFVARAATEPACLHYDFTIAEDVIFCREMYAGAEGALAHVANVGALLEAALKISDLVRLELHGPAAELEKLKGPLAAFRPAWFVRACGVGR